MFNDILSDFAPGYRSKYSSHHMILRLIEESKERLDKRFFAGAVLMNLSKAFYSIPHDLLTAKLNAETIQRFKDNFMIVNPGTFKAMIINRFGKMKNKQEMYIDYKKITSEHSIKLLCIEIDNKLKFDNHVLTLCRRAGSQLNVIGRLRKYIGFPEKKALMEVINHQWN